MDMVEKRLEIEKAKPGSGLRISRWKRILFTVVIFSVFLIALEMALRALDLPPTPQRLRHDGGLFEEVENAVGYNYKPGWSGYHSGGKTTINSFGWRGREFSIDKPPRTLRILGVGDSFTFGRAVDDEDIYLVRLEQMLNQDGGLRYETINSGHERINTVSELQFMKERQMMKLRPDIVVLGFTVHNDAQSSKNRKVFLKRKRQSSLLLRITESDRFKNLSDSFRLAKVIRGGAEWAVSDELAELHANIILDNYEEDSKSWKACREALLGILALCQENHTPLIVAIFPVYTRDINQTYKDYSDDFKKVHEQLKSVFSDRSGVTVVDMLDDLAASGLAIRDIRVPIDGHPNRVWHEMVARRLYQTIKDMGLKPTDGRK
jgi:hypothetical protein